MGVKILSLYDGMACGMIAMQPADRGILLKDVLDSAQCLRATCYKDGIRNIGW